jgi:hypothetical protein
VVWRRFGERLLLAPLRRVITKRAGRIIGLERTRLQWARTAAPDPCETFICPWNSGTRRLCCADAPTGFVKLLLFTARCSLVCHPSRSRTLQGLSYPLRGQARSPEEDRAVSLVTLSGSRGLSYADHLLVVCFPQGRGEVAIAVASLNRMLELGRPEYVRLT